jgi:hypothetical protein
LEQPTKSFIHTMIVTELPKNLLETTKLLKSIAGAEFEQYKEDTERYYKCILKYEITYRNPYTNEYWTLGSPGLSKKSFASITVSRVPITYIWRGCTESHDVDFKTNSLKTWVRNRYTLGPKFVIGFQRTSCWGISGTETELLYPEAFDTWVKLCTIPTGYISDEDWKPVLNKETSEYYYQTKAKSLAL